MCLAGSHLAINLCQRRHAQAHGPELPGVRRPLQRTAQAVAHTVGHLSRVMPTSTWNHNSPAVVRLPALFTGAEPFSRTHFRETCRPSVPTVHSMLTARWSGSVVDGFELDVDDIAARSKAANSRALLELSPLLCDLIGRTWLMACIGASGGIGDCGHCACRMAVAGGLDCPRERVRDRWRSRQPFSDRVPQRLRRHAFLQGGQQVGWLGLVEWQPALRISKHARPRRSRLPEILE